MKCSRFFQYFVPGLLALALIGCSSRSVSESASVEKMAVADARVAGSAAPGAEAMPVSVNFAQDRSVIRNGEIRVRVDEIAKAEEDLLYALEGWKGYVERSQSNNMSSTRQYLSVTVRVPVKKFDEAMSAIGGLGDVVERVTGAEDVTEEVVDVQARLRVMRAQEEVYLNLLKKAQSLKDSMTIQDSLMNLRKEVEGLDARLKSLSQQASMSTINVNFFTNTRLDGSLKSNNWLGDTWTQATNSQGQTFRSVGRFLVFVAVYSPFWLPFAGLFWWLRKRNQTRTKARMVPPPNA